MKRIGSQEGPPSARALVLLGLVAVLAGCQSIAERGDALPPKLSGGDGLTLERAVVITGGSDLANTDVEYAWLRQHAPGANVTGQELINTGKRVYDKLDVRLSDRSSRSYYFDITSGFGKSF